MSETPTYEGFAILELFGHVRLGGYLREEERFGTMFARLDVPAPDEQGSYTRYFGASSIYSFMPVSEEVARSVAQRAAPPVSSWELPQPALPPARDEEPETIDDMLDPCRRCGHAASDHEGIDCAGGDEERCDCAGYLDPDDVDEEHFEPDRGVIPPPSPAPPPVAAPVDGSDLCDCRHRRDMHESAHGICLVQLAEPDGVKPCGCRQFSPDIPF